MKTVSTSGHVLRNLAEGKKVYVRVERAGDTDPRPRVCRLSLLGAPDSGAELLVESGSGSWRRIPFDAATAEDDIARTAVELVGRDWPLAGRVAEPAVTQARVSVVGIA